MLVKAYQIEFTNSWPYEKEVAVHIADDSDPITLDAAGNDRMWRVHSGRGHVSWALVEGFDLDDDSPENLAARAAEVWVQVEYAVFSSRRAGDDKLLEKLRRRLRSKGIDSIGFELDLRPDTLAIGGMEDAFHSLRLNGDLRREPFNVLYVSEPSKIPTINGHTIPDGADFGWVDVQVATYNRYDAIPAYWELLALAKNAGSPGPLIRRVARRRAPTRPGRLGHSRAIEAGWGSSNTLGIWTHE